ncbi:hypothetical protein [Halomonas cerina]|uniref:O-antigen ligase n=1 Tax=Halomonas cerina TaxID=447424 RepID=A0A839V2Q5_9GAMM|nr:hypothetical protein [Halomonas cerina]MBB3189441.1 O-antigen ligase [Halomonas cerina]
MSSVHSNQCPQKIIVLFFILLLVFSSFHAIDPEKVLPGGLGFLQRNGRAFVYILLVLILLIFLFNSGNPLRSRRPPLFVSAYLFFLVLYSLKLLMYGFFIDSLLFFLICVFYYYLFGFLAISQHQKININVEDFLFICGASFFFIAVINGYVLFAESDFFIHSRFYGLTYNPNVLAYTISILSFAFLSFYKKVFPIAFLHAPVALVVLSLACILVLETGSRGGLSLMVFSFFFNAYILVRGRVILVLFSLFLFLLGILYFFDVGLTEYFDIFSGRQNTRFYVWEDQVDLFLKYPIFGEPWLGETIRFGENSYFGSASQLGVAGGVFIFFSLLLFLCSTIRFYIKRPKSSSSLILLFMSLSIIVSNFFEPWMLGAVSPVIYIFLLSAVSLWKMSWNMPRCASSIESPTSEVVKAAPMSSVQSFPKS